LTAPLVQATIRSALLFITGQAVTGLSAKAVALAEGVLKTMFLTKVKTTVAVMMAFGLLIAGAGALGYFGPSAAEAQDPLVQTPPEPPERSSKKPPVPRKDKVSLVKVVKPQQGGLERLATQAAYVEPFEQVEIYAQVAGLLKNQNVDIGDRVKKGQLLAEIDAPILLTEVDNATSNLESARDQVQISRITAIAPPSSRPSTRPFSRPSMCATFIPVL
jgi:HlyD family secretion protein